MLTVLPGDLKTLPGFLHDIQGLNVCQARTLLLTEQEVSACITKEKQPLSTISKPRCRRPKEAQDGPQNKTLNLKYPSSRVGPCGADLRASRRRRR